MGKSLIEECEELENMDLDYPNQYELDAYVIQDGKKHPFAVICPGGAYQMVCRGHEGITYAKRLNDAGYSAFILRYRCQEQAAFPNPMDDLARAVRYILANADKWNIDGNHYSVWGSSAGGHLVSSYGTETMGYRKYNLPKPDALILCYPVVSMTDELTHAQTRQNLLGENPTQEMIEKTSVELQITENYPPTFVFHGLADGAVPPENSRRLKRALDRCKVCCTHLEYPGVEHGVGLGHGLNCEGWFEKALDFLERAEREH